MTNYQYIPQYTRGIKSHLAFNPHLEMQRGMEFEEIYY